MPLGLAADLTVGPREIVSPDEDACASPKIVARFCIKSGSV